jgi:hypothetical protein
MLEGRQHEQITVGNLNGDGSIVEQALDVYKVKGLPGILDWLATMDNAMYPRVTGKVATDGR